MAGLVRDRKLSIAVGTLVLIHAAAIAAGFIAPYSYREQNRNAPRRAPTEIRFIDDDRRWHLRPFIESADGDEIVPLRFFVRGARYSLFGVVSTDVHLFGVDEPHRVFVLGTDALGRDYFSRLAYGAQLSLTAGLVAAALALIVALVLGAAAGYGGRRIDAAITWMGDVFLSLPWLYLLLAARAFLPLDLEPEQAYIVIVVLLGAVGWAAPMRILRAVVVGAKGREFVGAARSAGAGHVYILTRHVLPQTFSTLATQAALLIPAYMLAEVTLSFVGLGVGEPRPSWGNMLAELPGTSALSGEPWMFAPAILLGRCYMALPFRVIFGAQARPWCRGLWERWMTSVVRSVARCVALLWIATVFSPAIVFAGECRLDPRRGGRLVVATRSEAKHFNPLIAVDQPTRTVQSLLNADLLRINRATHRVEPNLASSWETSDDGRVFTVTLREGIRFSDGHPLTVDDVLFTFRVYLDESVGSAAARSVVRWGRGGSGTKNSTSGACRSSSRSPMPQGSGCSTRFTCCRATCSKTHTNAVRFAPRGAS